MNDTMEITDFIDVRSVNKHAFTMLKSSVSIDKSIHHTYRTRVKAVPSDYNSVSLAEGSESVDTESIYEPLKVLAHRPSSVREAHYIQLRNAKEDETNKKVWEVFKAYEVGTGDIPFDCIETAIPVDKLEEAMETLFLCEVIGNLDGAKDALKGLYYENSMLTFLEFKELVHYVVLLQEQKTRKSPRKEGSAESVISATSVPDSFQNLVQKQRMVSALVLDDLVDAASVSQSSSNMKLGGKMMNTSVFKDAVVDVLNEDYRARRHPIKLGKLRSGSIRSFNDSRDDIEIDVGSIDGNDSPDLRLTHNNSPQTAAESATGIAGAAAAPKRKVNHNPVDVMQKSKVAGLMNPEEEYYSKWIRMKEKRDARLQREYKRKVREDLMHTFSRVVHHSQKNDKMKAKQDMRDFRKMEEEHNRQEAQRRRKILQEGLQNRMHAEQTRKRKEVNYIRETLKSGAALAREMKREDQEVRLMHSRSLSAPFELDASSSTIIHIPTALVSRVKNAKSLLAYEAAKKEIKSFYENTLSERIATFSKSKEFAVKRAAQFGTPITLAPIEGEYFFDDSICDDSDSESLALKEYFKHRGRQGRVLEEDSTMHLLPLTGTHSSASSVNGRSGQINLLSGRLGELSV